MWHTYQGIQMFFLEEDRASLPMALGAVGRRVLSLAVKHKLNGKF